MFMRTCVEGLCAVPMEAGLYHVLTFVKARVLMDQNIYLKVTSGGWSMRKDSVTTARKRLERCVCVFVIGIFFWFIIISVTWDHKYNCPIGLSVINQNVNIWMLQVVDGVVRGLNDVLVVMSTACYFVTGVSWEDQANQFQTSTVHVSWHEPLLYCANLR